MSDETNRANGLTVVLAKDYNMMDLEPLRQAILQFKGVIAVDFVPADVADFIARGQARHELSQGILAVLYPSRAGTKTGL